ncbi:hypothetical protein LTR84_007563 [Exophiala bonariae]|uniref:Uncharacterized protein n=1 Tax=Exophiala bonariae TaxID=1690606 RepID=A0AAV9NMW5_9EURO|nr:hypothetical protein LTR84_007563 [Exophiala bonariae]
MEVEIDQQANPVANSHHRKIELQSPLDLAYLQANLSKSARQKLDLHFPPSAYIDSQVASAPPATVISLDGIKGADLVNAQDTSTAATGPGDEADKDPLRARVRELVDAFMARTWEGAAKNITVNGLDVTLPQPATSQLNQADSEPKAPEEEKEGVDFVYEAYDSHLQFKLAGLYGELEGLTAQVSRLRRTTPKQGAGAFQEALAADIASDDAAFEAQMSAIRERAATADQNPLGLRAQRDGWDDDVKVMYERGTNGLAGLAGLGTASTNDTSAGTSIANGASLTETVGKVQRARNVAMEFE